MKQNGETFDWENDDLANVETDWTDDKLVHQDFIGEIPGIETEAKYEDIVGPHLAAQGYTPTVTQQVAATCHSTGCTKERNSHVQRSGY